MHSALTTGRFQAIIRALAHFNLNDGINVQTMIYTRIREKTIGEESSMSGAIRKKYARILSTGFAFQLKGRVRYRVVLYEHLLAIANHAGAVAQRPILNDNVRT